MRGYIGITNTEAKAGDMTGFPSDTWLFTRIHINSDKTVESITCTGNYDDASVPGTQIQSLPTIVSEENWYNVQNGNIYFYFDDTYNTSAYLTVGEVIIANSEPIILETQTIYDFSDGLIPSDFTTNGTWTIDNTDSPNGKSLYIEGNVDDSLSFIVTNAVAVKIRCKISHNGGDSAPLDETATSLLLSRNHMSSFWISVYANGTTAFPSEWCEFTVPSDQLGDTRHSFHFKTVDGQKLWIDEIEVINGSGTVPTISAGFTASPLSGTTPLEVQFTDLSTGNPTSWAWDFGDGSTSTVQNPSHTYESVGSYTVMLTVS
ncbi:MAG: hypothetical protein DRP89_01620, partial [Candidatus Neomarinimicrobiota bacterium]